MNTSCCAPSDMGAAMSDHHVSPAPSDGVAGCCVVPTEAAPLAFDPERLATLCKALGHPARVKLLKILMARDACVCGELVEELPLAQSTISEHLRILKEAGLVQGIIDGPRRCYCVDHTVLRELAGLMGGLIT